MRKTVVIVPLVVLLVSCVSVVSIGWYFSSVATSVEHGRAYRFTIRGVSGDTVTLPRDATTSRPGVWGLIWPGGRAVLGPVVGGDARTVQRRFSVVFGRPAPGSRAVIDHWVYGRDPRRDLGLEFRDVVYPSSLGPMPAWFLPGRSSVWVIAVHGRNASRFETFRALKAVHASGMPVLSISYRNDVGAPRSPDHRNLMGYTEWRDITSAIAYARGHGASGVVLYGYSMGGGMVVNAVRHDASFVRGLVLDSPVLDWNATLDKQAGQRSLPSFVTAAAKRILAWRMGIDLSSLDARTYAPRLRTPTLLFTTDEDALVDNRPSYEFARLAPRGMVTHISAHADHTDAWNVDPVRYEKALSGFLGPLLSARPEESFP
ncbi:alpha/beta hydrolase family protein [Actinomadura rubteroloni]|uniref:alpha/beta hydrolase family protein n=1 Tax=Actinomadura rubteroloni TaxID=1926885 RepID=UPI00143DD167|nr:alpha/beta fold hydrolase [Actinomadura rubteroloni]